ncbi:conserved hypothetical protein [Talaromyces stipitatus ATCC 10500]|uniref:Uncharacterized protein n=1 Tax=Talaromyces stipitatus (strain ATCC 10500 / CBS 375.48 / QM 6759 / NRRL 1006) TaxID=441959 RepID=B8M6V7_TALSN|nr:uncharacterized protein TSTA_034170 [Talaromyces stipitatus ATCC 10500]EED20177.1 conserved hypothetical protein [Talaromyces stipitatus ATCC 10500]
MEAIWRFHHETWDEPWSSDDFPAGESEKEIDQRLRNLGQSRDKELTSQWPWGYTIYCTVYTPKSDQHWDALLEAIPKNTYTGLGPDLHDDEPSRIFKEGYRPLVFNDPAQFDGATLDEILIDEGALQSINRHPSWVTVVDPNYRGGSSYNTQYYPGYFRLYLSDLWSLTRIGRAFGLDDVCGRMKGPNDVPWFDSDMY